jgi:4-hydroxy-tetrahydrodipicolinate synthase
MSGSFDLLDPQRAPRGVATLLKTPFKTENRLDEESYRRQVRHVIDAGTVLLIPGMQGSETYCLPPEDRDRCIEICLEESDERVPVCPAVCGIGIYDVANAAVKAQKMGADLIAIIPPPWITDEGDAARCLEQVARSVDLPVMIHSAFGGASSKIFASDTVDRLAREVANIRYVKVEGPRFVQQTVEIRDRSGDLVVRLMSAPSFSEVYRAGCRLLMIAAHIIEPLVALFDALEDGNDAAAERIEADLRPYYAVEGYVPGEICNKTVAHWRGIFADARRGAPQLSPSPATLLPNEVPMLAKSLEPLRKYFTTFPLALPQGVAAQDSA